MTLASSRATSQRITSPSGLRAAPFRKITFETEPWADSSSSAFSDLSLGATIRRWTTRRG